MSKTAGMKLKLLWENGKRCRICGKPIKHFDDMTLDHIIPKSKGGRNVIGNCQLAHMICNCKKADKIIPKRDLEQLLRGEKWMIVGKCFVGFGMYLVGLAMFYYAMSKWI